MFKKVIVNSLIVYLVIVKIYDKQSLITQNNVNK